MRYRDFPPASWGDGMADMPLQASGRKSTSGDEGFGPRATIAALGSCKRFHLKLGFCSRDKSFGGKKSLEERISKFSFLFVFHF